MVIIEIAAEYFGQAFDTGNRGFELQPILISQIQGVILPQGNLAGTS